MGLAAALQADGSGSAKSNDRRSLPGGFDFALLQRTLPWSVPVSIHPGNNFTQCQVELLW
jgi:hypothetical protein